MDDPQVQCSSTQLLSIEPQNIDNSYMDTLDLEPVTPMCMKNPGDVSLNLSAFVTPELKWKRKRKASCTVTSDKYQCIADDGTNQIFKKVSVSGDAIPSVSQVPICSVVKEPKVETSTETAEASAGEATVTDIITSQTVTTVAEDTI